MAALLNLVNAVRAVRDSLRTLTDLLPRGIVEPLNRQEQQLATFFDDIGLGSSLTPRQAEGLVTLLYERVAALEDRFGEPRLLTFVQRRAVASLRATVVDLELLLIPERERDWALLGITRHDDLVTVKSRFRALARKHHPDVTGGDSKRMEELNRAYRLALRTRGARG